MAVQGLLVGLSSLPGAGIPAAILAARKQSADATIRAAYYRGQELINYNRPEYYDKEVGRLARRELALIMEAIEQAAGLR